MFLRERLASLTLSDNFGREAVVFSKKEIREEPIKWLKYLLLDKLGLESISVIEDQIFRFDFHELEDAKSLAKTMLERDANQMFVIKVVPWDIGAQLKNYRLYSGEHIEDCFAQLTRDFPLKTHEIWCCGSSVSNDGFNLGGRITFPLGSKEHILEMVWFSSPRRLEQVSLPNFEYPYIQSIGSRYSFQFEISKLHLPATPASPIIMDELMGDYYQFMSLLEDRRENMEKLSQFLFKFGAQEVAYTFKVSNGRLTIIDWDSEIESTDGK